VFAYSVISNRNIAREILKYTACVMTLSIIVNIWWLIPFLYYVEDVNKYIGHSIIVDVKKWSFTHRRASFLNLFWLNGFWGWQPEYYHYITLYTNLWMKLIVFIPAIIGFITLLIRYNKNRAFNLYYAITILALIFLAKGIHPPLETANLILHNNVPLLSYFREPVKFMHALPIFLSFLIGDFINSTAKYNSSLSHNRKRCIAGIVLTGLLASSFIISALPLVTGDVYHKAEVVIPNYWYEASNFINSKTGDFKILLTPNDDFYAMPYKWGYIVEDQITLNLFKHDTVYLSFVDYNTTLIDDKSTIRWVLWNTIISNKSNEFTKILSLMNIKYVILRNDLIWKGRNVIPPNVFKAFLSCANDLQLAGSYGDIEIYTFVPERSPLHIYVPSKIVTMDGNANDMFRVIALDSFTTSTAIVLKRQLEPNQQAILEKILTRKSMQNINISSFKSAYIVESKSSDMIITFKKVSPVKYIVNAKNVKEPFFLVFSEPYHYEWKAYAKSRCRDSSITIDHSHFIAEHLSNEILIDDMKYLFSEYIDDNYHFIVNGFANGWVIDPSQLDMEGELTITLYHRTQSIVYFGLLTLSLTLSLCIVYYVYSWMKNRSGSKST
ncbi:MAG: alpha-(1-_3)-arabinofuranosyltransferase family protein, partial [Nitrososphaerota archaeon]